MLTIPAWIKTLLKSRSMTGPDRPRWTLTVRGAAGAAVNVPDVLGITIQRQLYQAATLEFALDNKAGKYAPDGAGPWQYKMWPNSEVIVTLGYGAHMAQAFRGLIDSVEMSRTPRGGAIMTVTARDLYKRALDQMITNPADSTHVWLFVAKTCEAIFTDLALAAGWAAPDITAQVSGITIAEKVFAWESYADAFLWLCEVSGFEVVVTETGKIEFRFASDRQPEAMDEALVLTGTAWTNLANSYVVGTSERIRSAQGGGTLYVRGVDYETEYGSPARVRRTVGSSIASGATVYGTYVYAAWRFREGEDLYRIGYKIDDDDLFAEILVQGMSASGEPILAVVDTFLTPYWNLPVAKAKFVSAPDVANLADCAKIGRRIAASSAQRARRADFGTVGWPWLQVGDCVQVVESSTTISEIYRITGMELRLDPTGFTTQLQTHYYGYTPAPVTE